MNKQESFLKYLDNQMTDFEKDELEKLIESDREANQLFEEVRRRKADTLKHLERPQSGITHRSSFVGKFDWKN